MAQRRTCPNCDRSIVVHRESGLRYDIQNTTKSVAVFCGESAGHDVHGCDVVRTQSGREHGVRVLPKSNAIDKWIQRDLAATYVNEVVVAANHSWRTRNDEIRKIRTQR